MAVRRLLLPFVVALAGATPSAPAVKRIANVNVSRAPGSQAEVRIAADPLDPSHLLAASNSEPGMRVYGSTDGGRTWSSEILPSPPNSAVGPCQSDPAPAIDAGGNEYVAFIQSAQRCDQSGEHVTMRVAVREAGEGTWRYRSESAIPEDPRGSFDDNPWLVVDTDPASPYSGRLYLAWFRSVEDRRVGFEISHSDDRGAHWSEPRVVSDRVVDAGYPSLSIGDGGAVYAAWHDFARRSLFLDVSSDGGETFGPDVAWRLRGRDEGNCPNGRSIPAQRLRCVRSDPTVLADPARGRVYLTYSDLARNGSEDVLAAAYDAHLRPVAGFPRRIGATERTALDQFWPTAALDSSTGRLALCFYATGGGKARTRATFSCALSNPSGRRWSRVVKVASVPSDETRPGATEFGYGDYEGLVVAGGIAHPIWTDSRNLRASGEEIYAAAFPLALHSSTPDRQVNVSNAPGSQNEAAIAVDPSNPNVLIASSNSLVSPMSVNTSLDGGGSWSRQAVPADRRVGSAWATPR